MSPILRICSGDSPGRFAGVEDLSDNVLTAILLTRRVTFCDARKAFPTTDADIIASLTLVVAATSSVAVL